MAKKLLIVESPAKARTIQQYLGKEYEVLASVGHVRDLPKSDKNAIDIEKGFRPHYIISPGKLDVIERIRRAAAKADEIYLATDPDREGEAISWHIKEAVGLKHPKRVVFHEITKAAIEEALTHPRHIDEDLRKAQEARRVLDRIVGYDLSGLIWKKVRYGLSAGRVQSPALRILAEREREIQAFVPVTYFVLSALFKAKSGEFSATCSEEPKTREEADKLLAAGKAGAWSVAKVVERAEDRNPRPPFTTSTLQQVASTRLGFSPSRTMRAAQKLYEAGHITYMRTDSVNLGKDAVNAILSIVERKFGKEYVDRREYKTKSKNAQEAHEAVRPTDPAREKAGSTTDEANLYELIRTRALASQMAAAKVLRTSVSVATPGVPAFTANGSRVTFPGWLALDTKARGEDVELPKLAEGEVVELKSLEGTEKQTEPPNRYTEAGLVKELEKRGIGRPSTYASIMKTIQDREYALKEGRTLMPTATGMVVSGWLEEHFAEYISDSFTAEMEDELDEIARGEREYEKTLAEFYKPFRKAVDAKEDLPKATSLGDVPEKFHCPDCESAMEFKLGRGGVFMSCKRYPECEGARGEDGTEIRPDEPIGTHPDTGMPVYIKTGRFGPYVEMPLKQAVSSELVADSLTEEPKEEEKPKKRKAAKKPARAKKPKKVKIEAKRASVPPGTDLATITLADAVKWLSLPRELGVNPDTGKMISSGVGRFGPFVVHDGEFRSLKAPLDPYTITLEHALALIKEPKKPPRGVESMKELGKHPRTGKTVILYKSKQGHFLKKGLRRIYIPESVSPHSLSVVEALEYLK
ncbi:MAG: type I DNA topoisomerase [Candidatus Pacebacteria bacterium]|nr:type I DNA topoisomerase [Candidatus Paceibacterota bacterium]MBP9840436.1 type I DNA topoisomerase [Candidatus Paceibacterota bacterium]